MTTIISEANQAVNGDKAAHTVAKFRDYLLGPARFMNLVSCFELGVVDLLRAAPDTSMTAQEIAERVGAKKDAIDQLLQQLVRDQFLRYDTASGSYGLDGLAHLSDRELEGLLVSLDFMKVVCYRQLYYLAESIKTGSVVGLKEFYGFEGNLYDATSHFPDLRTSWAALMDRATSIVDPWFLEHVDVEPNAKVLDVAGNTGTGAILFYRRKSQPGLHVTCFDLPAKESAALENFRSEGLEQHCAFVGGDVFSGLPEGFDIVMIKHFFGMFDQDDVIRILKAAYGALKPGGQLYVLETIYSEMDDPFPSVAEQWLPVFFLGCAMGKGGLQRQSTYETWIESSGFTVSGTLLSDAAKSTGSVPPPIKDALIRATKV